MATTTKELILPKFAEITQETQYTPVGVTAIIDKFTIVNVTVASHLINVWITPVGGAADDSNKIISNKILLANETYPAFEIVNMALNPGSSIITQAADPNSLNIRASGRETSN